ncbi:MAG: PfaD family polyunsaturated fatty acid/polyketide biosynthesis protein [Planctomycetota bacterium]|nr:PfaD family polyunsaturated fatty acid/polyketide biosynthesis protein [Planctomycetota bacterium]
MAPQPVESFITEALADLSQPFYIVTLRDGSFAVGRGGVAQVGEQDPPAGACKILGHVPACKLEHLGDPSFLEAHRIRYAYLTGAMANGIGSTEVVAAMGRAGMLGFFGSAGLLPAEVEAAIDRLERDLGKTPFGFNLIHSPNEPNLEAAVVDLYLRRDIHLVEASAYLDLTLPIIRYRCNGIHRGPSGEIVTPNQIIAKASRVEVATKFFSPPPEARLRELVAMGEITEAQAALAASIPMAQDLTVEADSAGHTDNRPALAVLPTMLALRDRMQARYEYEPRLRVGLAGGISTPASAAAAFAMGAGYVLTGSVNQASVEAGTSDFVREMLAEAGQADIMMAPAADMFEMGVKLQVLKRGTMFGMRASKLYDLYRSCSSVEDIPAAERSMIEKNLFRASLDDIWEKTVAFFEARDPSQIELARKDPKRKMGLIFRWYLGMSSIWANSGEPTRKMDYQIWCGPAMGAFNEWVAGSPLELLRNRSVVTMALNILHGAAVLSRVHALRCQGTRIPSGAGSPRPLDLETLMERIR